MFLIVDAFFSNKWYQSYGLVRVFLIMLCSCNLVWYFI